MRLRFFSSFGFLNLQKKVALGLSLISAIFVGLSWAAHRTIMETVEAKNKVSHTYEVLRMLEGVASNLKDVETGQQGYMIYGQEVYLGPYYAGLKAVHQDIKTLRRLIQGNPVQQQRIDMLESLVLKKIAIASMLVEARRSQGLKESKRIGIFDSSSQTMQNIRRLIQQMEDTEVQLLSQRSRQADASRKVAIRLILPGLGVQLVILFGLFYVISREVNAHQQSEAELLESETRFRRLSEATFEAVAISEKGKVLDTNHGFIRLFGYKFTEVIGMSAMEFVVPECQELVRQKVMSGSEDSYEVVSLRKDGTTFPTEIQGKMMHFRGCLARVTAFRDITERKKTELKLQTYATQLERVNQELEQFNYIAAHDLKTPLRAISTRIELLAKQLGPLSEDVQRQLSRISLATLRMDSFLNDLISYSQIGNQTKSLVLTDSQAIVDQVLHYQLQQQIQQSGATIKVGSPLPTVLADAAQLAQVFQHLIDNGIKFCRITPHIKVFATCSPTECTFCISDNGIGIPAGTEERIFEVFKKLHTQEDYEGTGIGLAIAKRIIDWHGGRIWVESKVGKGSQFFFTLQRAQYAEARNGALIEILLVEDNLDDVEFIQLSLQEAKLVNRLHHVWDGEAAIAFLKNSGNPGPDLILLDLNLPKLDGREVLQIIKSDESLQRIPIIVLTTSGLGVDAQSYTKYTYAYLNKPVKFDEFIRVLHQFNNFRLQIVKLPNDFEDA